MINTARRNFQANRSANRRANTPKNKMTPAAKIKDMFLIVSVIYITNHSKVQAGVLKQASSFYRENPAPLNNCRYKIGAETVAKMTIVINIQN